MRKFSNNNLLKNLGITFGESVITKGLNFLIIILLTRSLGPVDYGKFSFLFAMIALSCALFDFGMENTAVRFSSREKDKKDAIFGLYLIIKFLILIILLPAILLGGEFLLGLIGKEEISPFLPYLLFGLIGESLFYVNDTYLQANQHFRLRAILSITRYSISALYIMTLITFNLAYLQWVFLLYLVPLFVSMVFIGAYIRFIHALLKEKLEHGLLQEMWQYERWMMNYSIANNLLGRIDFFMLALWVGFSEIGIYNAAFQLCAIISFLPYILGKVLLPALAELDENGIFQTTQKVSRITLAGGILAALLIPIAPVLIPLLLGEDYAEATSIVQILLLSFVAGLMSMPYEQALYSLGKPQVMGIGRYTQLGVVVILNILTIPRFGIYAAAFNTLVGRVLYLFLVKKAYQSHEMKVSRQALMELSP